MTLLNPGGDVEQTFDAALVGADRTRDLVVLQLLGAPAAALRPVQLGSSAGLRVGQQCLAIGWVGEAGLIWRAGRGSRWWGGEGGGLMRRCGGRSAASIETSRRPVRTAGRRNGASDGPRHHVT